MADLDDFFAKKDKKKSKSKLKFPTPDELPKGPEEPKTELETDTETLSADTPQNLAKEEPVAEEEWKDFEEEQRKDYTGLKIGQLNINDDEDQSLTNGDDDDFDSDGNVGSEGNKRSGEAVPWKKLIPAEEVTQIPIELGKPEKSSKVYISPAMRAEQQGLATRPKPRRAAPDITNADYFPSLDAARPEKQRKKKTEAAFEEVRHGGRIHRVTSEGQSSAQPAAASNRFQSLDEEDS